MNLAMFARQYPNEEILAFSRQVGATHVLVGSPMTTESGSYNYENLLDIKERVESAGLEFGVITAGLRGLDRKTLGNNRTLNKVVLGLPGRDEQIENWCTNLRNLGRAGIPILAYDFTDFFLRTSRRDTARYGRGGGRFSAYDHELAIDEFISADLGVDVTGAGEVTDEMLWANVTYFLNSIWTKDSTSPTGVRTRRSISSGIATEIRLTS